MSPGIQKFLKLLALLSLAFLALRFLLPLALPFLLGLALALAAEPAVALLSEKCRLPRPIASALGVTLAFSLLTLGIAMLLGLVIREVRSLAGLLPGLAGNLRAAMDTLSLQLLSLADRAPDSLRPMLTRNVTELFSGGSALLDKAVDFLLRLASGILSRVPGSALGLGTGIIASFMISAKFPSLRGFVRTRIPQEKLSKLRDALTRLRIIIFSWLKAQVKLSGVTFSLTLCGFWLLGIPRPLLWALLIALVDAFPILGTGTVLVPWSIISFTQADHFRAFGLLGLYAAAALSRSALEPKLVGKHLGLDPLVTLIALYVGFRLFGLPGMLLSPLLAVAVIQLSDPEHPTETDR